MQALPVYKDIGGALGFDSQGVVIEFDWETEQARPTTDHRWIITAAVSAAEKYPELREILPDRPPRATTCSKCLGAGKIALTPTSNFGCGECCGLGWVETK
jgi:hypothetical protein